MTAGIKANADGSAAIQVGGSDAITMTSGLVVSMNGGVGGLVSGTAVPSTSGTSVDFTSIPSWVRRITVMFNGVSTNGAAQNLIAQIGDGSVNITGYSSGVAYAGAGSTGANFTNGFGVANGLGAGNIFSGIMTITTLGSNVWVASVVGGLTDSAFGYSGGGNKTLTGTLDRVRITTSAGSATFDAGSINIFYE